MIPRDYQSTAIQSIYDYFNVADGNPVLELPTGSGKSFVQAEFLRQVVLSFPGQRILCLTHVKELVKQNHAELMGIWPQAPAGIYSASLNRRDTRHPIIFASIQSVYSRAKELGRFNLVIIDECHLVSNKGTGMYRELLDALKVINPKLKVIGMSATPWRLDNGPLTAGDNAIFTDLISAKKLGATLPRLIELGHLAPLTTPANSNLPQLSTQGVGKRGGDFIPSQLNKAIAEQHSVTVAACEALVRHGADRQCWIVFGSSVAHCDEIHFALSCLGIECAVVTGETNKDLRDMRIDALREGSLRALISVNVLSTGFNVRQVDLIAGMRPSQSSSLYLQMMGRGMRTAEGKTDCLVLDFAGLIATHGPVDHVKPPPVKSGKGGGDAVQKECPECIMLIPAGSMTCQFCGHQFPAHEIKIAPAPSNLKVMGKPDPVEYKPTKAVYMVHKKAGKPDSLRVTYYAGLRAVGSQWVCLEHSGFARQKAQQWWIDFADGYLPSSAESAAPIARLVARLPSSILVDESGKYPIVKEATL